MTSDSAPFGAGSIAVVSTPEPARLRVAVPVQPVVARAPALAGAPYAGTQNGYYLQGVYQFGPPQWRAGLRYDRLDASNEVGAALAATPLAASHAPTRLSAMVDFSNSEFSRLRFQWSRDRSRPETDTQLFLQYLMSMGAHGAHRF